MEQRAIAGTDLVSTVAVCLVCRKWHGFILRPSRNELVSESPAYDTPEEAWAACDIWVKDNVHKRRSTSYGGRLVRGGAA